MKPIPARFDDSHFALVNELLKTVSADGAYRMGLVSTLSLISGVEPTRELFEGAIACRSTAEVADWFESFRRKGKKVARRKKP